MQYLLHECIKNRGPAETLPNHQKTTTYIQVTFRSFQNSMDTKTPSYGCFLLVNHNSCLSIKLTPTIKFGLSLHKKQNSVLHIKAILALKIVTRPFEVQPLPVIHFNVHRSTFRCIPMERYTWPDLRSESGNYIKL